MRGSLKPRFKNIERCGSSKVDREMSPAKKYVICLCIKPVTILIYRYILQRPGSQRSIRLSPGLGTCEGTLTGHLLKVKKADEDLTYLPRRAEFALGVGGPYASHDENRDEVLSYCRTIGTGIGPFRQVSQGCITRIDGSGDRSVRLSP